MSELKTLREQAADGRLDTYNVDGGLGVRFSDGFDVYWHLPEERWYRLHQDSTLPVYEQFAKLDEQRRRAIDVVRRYLAQLQIVIHDSPNGSWILEEPGGCTSEVNVGPLLTDILARGPNLGVAVQEIFKGSAVQTPSTRRVKQLLAEFGTPHRPHVSTGKPEAAVQTPLSVLQCLRLCKMLHNQCRFDSLHPPSDAAHPKGRVWRALLQFAKRLSYASAYAELADNSMHVDFGDQFASFVITPNSSDLRKLVRALGPEQAGNHLADEFERLNIARREVLNAAFTVLNRHGFYLDSLEEEYVGRDTREFTLDLGDNLTAVIAKSGNEAGVKHVFGSHIELTTEAIETLGHFDEPVSLATRPLRRASPEPLELPRIAEEQIAELDEQSRSILRRFIKSDAALSAFFDRLRWDGSVDTWAETAQWQKLAQKHVGGKSPRPDAEYILYSCSDGVDLWRYRERLIGMEPHLEICDQYAEMMWRLRNDLPDQAAQWFGPHRDCEDVPFVEVRAGLGDPIAARFLLDSWNDGEDEVIPSALAQIPRSVIVRIATPAQLNDWRDATVRWAIETWHWEHGGEHNVLAAAANMGWQEVDEHLAANPHLLCGFLDPPQGAPGVLFAGDLILAWSKLKPSSAFLMNLIGFAMNMDRNRIAKCFAEKSFGSFATEVAKNGTVPLLNAALAIAWHRCRHPHPNTT